MSKPIKIGVSACLLGEKIRPGGSHARSNYLTQTLSKHVEFIPLCPEMACGMGINREKVRQVQCSDDIRLIAHETGEDWTERMDSWCSHLLPGLEEDELSGFILKNNSPSCALKMGKIYDTTGKSPRHGQGFFTTRLAAHFPLLPLESDEGLKNPILRENFIHRIYVLDRWHTFMKRGGQIGHLVDFHTRHKLLVMAHSPDAYRELGRMLARLDNADLDALAGRYINRLMEVLNAQASRKRHVNVLQHVLGYLRKHVDAANRADLVDVIDDYRRGVVPLVVPVTLLKHHFRRSPNSYISQQVYMDPHPRELMLRNML